MHKFYLGCLVPGCIHLGLWAILLTYAIVLGSRADFDPDAGNGIVALLWWFLALNLVVVPLAEAITYFTRSAGDFERINLVGKRPWF